MSTDQRDFERMGGEAQSLVQELVNAIEATGGPIRDRDLPKSTLNGTSGRIIRFAKAQGCMRIAFDEEDIGVEIPGDFARDVSGEAKGTTYWNALLHIRSAFGGLIPAFVRHPDCGDGILHTPIAERDERRLDMAIAAGEAWSLYAGVEPGNWSGYTFALGKALATLEPPVVWGFESRNEITTHPDVIGLLAPACHRLEIELPSQAKNAVTARTLRGSPPRGYIKLRRAETRRRIVGNDHVASMRLVGRVGEALERHGRTVTDIATVRAKDIPMVDMSEAVEPRTIYWQWPTMIPVNAEHELTDLGMHPVWAGRVADDLMEANRRAGHRIPAFVPRESNGAFRWYDAAPGTPGRGISMAQGTIEMLGDYHLLFEHEGRLLPDPLFMNKIHAQALARGGNDGEVLRGIPLEETLTWRTHSYGLLDLRSRPTFLERSEGCHHHQHQRKALGIVKGDPVLPALRVGSGIWIDHTLDARRYMPDPACLPAQWRAMATTEQGLEWRTIPVIHALAAYIHLDREYDLGPYIDAGSELGGILHVPAESDVNAPKLIPAPG